MTKAEARKNRKRRKILLSLIMIVFVGVVLTTSTYAWFTANRTVTVSSIDINVSTSEGLQISTDAINWKAIVTNTDITGASTTYSAAINQVPSGNIVPVSTVGTVVDGLMPMYKGKVETNASTGSNILTSTKSTETNGTNGDFVAFDLFFQSSQAQTVYLTSSSSVIAKGDDKGIQNAARVAFIKEGSVAYGSAASAAQSIIGNVATWIWEPNYDVHTTSGISNASNVYGVTTTAGPGATKLTYQGLKAAFDDTANVPLNGNSTSFANYFGDVTTVETAASGIPTSAYLSAFDVAEGVTKVRIYMWIEGQDVDCEDHASGSALTYNLQFSIDSSAS